MSRTSVLAVLCTMTLGASLAVPAPGASPSAMASTVASPAWHEHTTSDSPGRPGRAAVAFDAGSQELILFGGVDDGVQSDETWAWDGTDWTLLDPPTRPRARQEHAMAYDPVRDEVVMFGGYGDGRYLFRDTWVFHDGVWEEKLSTGAPKRRKGASMAFDPNLQQVVMFGGYKFDPIGTTNETWAWDGTTWTRLHPATSPPARWRCGLAYDPSRDALVLFGGDQDFMEFADDTWVWDGTSWTEQHPTRRPTARSHHGLATWGNRVVMFGGESSTKPALGDTWVLKSTKWRRLRLDPAPSPRSRLNLGWDSVRGEAVLYGAQGAEETDLLLDSWTLSP